MITKEQNILTMLDLNLKECESLGKITYILGHIGLNTFNKRTECINWLRTVKIIKESSQAGFFDINHDKIKQMLKKYRIEDDD